MTYSQMEMGAAVVREFLVSRAEATATATATARHGPSHGQVVFWVDIFLVLCLAVFVLPFLPQIYGRLRTRTDWGKGLFICE